LQWIKKKGFFAKRFQSPTTHNRLFVIVIVQILKMLRVAWDRRLIFTIGRSVTSGSNNVVTWNEIHHKTNKYPGGSHGFPDPNYFTNVVEELKAQGVTQDDIK